MELQRVRADVKRLSRKFVARVEHLPALVTSLGHLFKTFARVFPEIHSTTDSHEIPLKVWIC